MGLGRQHALEHRRGAKRRLYLTNVGGLDSERLADVGKEALEVAARDGVSLDIVLGGNMACAELACSACTE